jgi:EAL domain-containing protein (putative c-di-GMP-specific phosphodiesterase class I)
VLKPPDFQELSCQQCINLPALSFDFSMAFQPIVNIRTRTIFAHEALVRGINNEPSSHVFGFVNDTNRYRFDQSCRVKAIKLASALDIPGLLSINIMPNAVYKPELCIRTTLKAAEEFGLPVDKIIFEVTESERITNLPHLQAIFHHYQERGFTTAIDDFGAGYAGLNLLAEFNTDFIKLDMAIVQGIARNHTRKAIVRGILQVCRDLNVLVIAEGVEALDDISLLHDMGVDLFQGYYFAKPAFEALPQIANLH